jgi:hypothetical protein
MIDRPIVARKRIAPMTVVSHSTADGGRNEIAPMTGRLDCAITGHSPTAWRTDEFDPILPFAISWRRSA